jgi:putative ABC transport system permease protein
MGSNDVIAEFIIDLRAAWVGLKHSRMVLVTASLVLGLGLAATVYMQTVTNTFYFKPPPFRDSERLYRVFGQHELTREIQDELSFPDYIALREADGVEDATAVTWTSAVVTGEGIAQSFEAAEVTTNFFDLLGVRPLLGRTFAQHDGISGAEPMAILSGELWSSRYASDESIVGRRATINGESRTIVGVLAPGFGLIGGEDIWLPIQGDASSTDRQSETPRYGWVIAKAEAGISAERLGSSLDAVMDRLQRQYPQTNESLGVTLLPIGAGIIGHANISSLRRQLAGAYATLVIACLTVAGLLFVRANYRQFETAMRSALGASRWRLIQMSVCEALIISAFALLVAYFVSVLSLQYYTHLVDTIGLYGGVPPWWLFEVDWRVVWVSIGATLLSALMAGLLPAIEASRPNVSNFLRERAHVTGSPRLTRFMGVMVVIEIAAAVALLYGALLLARGAYTTVGKSFGIDPNEVMTAGIELPASRYAGPQYAQFADSVLNRLRSRPGVRGAALATSLPGMGGSQIGVAIGGLDGVPISELPKANDVYVSSGFFKEIGGHLLAGREFDSRDVHDSAPVAIVNAEFVSRYLGGKSPIGQKIAFPVEEGAPMRWFTVIGVANNILQSSTWDTNGSWRPAVYTPLTQYDYPYLKIAVRGGGAPADQMRLITEVVAEVDKDLPVYMLRPLARAQSETRAGYQLGSVSMLGFSFIAVILAIVGMYVVLAFTVGQRTKEIAIRRALGASDAQVVSTVIRGTILQVVVGLLVGAALTPFAATLVSSIMEGLQTQERWLYFMAFGFVAVAAVVASAGPARRALRVEPAILLRTE